jgi:hypothetical protein
MPRAVCLRSRRCQRSAQLFAFFRRARKTSGRERHAAPEREYAAASRSIGEPASHRAGFARRVSGRRRYLIVGGWPRSMGGNSI